MTLDHVADEVDGLVEFPETPFIDGIASQEMLSQDPCCPSTKLGASFRIDAIADGKNSVQVEVLDLISLAVRGSCCKKCNN